MHQGEVGAVQFIFGVAGEQDPAASVVQRLARAFPDRDIVLVISSPPIDGNAKIANLVAMSALIKYDVVVMSDSDIRVMPTYLRQMCDALHQTEVGLVTCLYRGGDGSGLWSRLSTMAIDFHFFPSVLLGARLGKARPCMGATMALSARTLDQIGGFPAFSSNLADDYAIGEAVRATGQRVVVAAQVVVHQCNEQTAAEVFLHELRWARTIRSIDPIGYAGSFITHPLPFAMLALLVGSHPIVAVSCLLASMACRILLQRQVEAAMGISTHRWLLGPMRDVLAFAVFIASFATNSVVWRGQRFRIRPDGTMMRMQAARSEEPLSTSGETTMGDARAAAGGPALS